MRPPTEAGFFISCKRLGAGAVPALFYLEKPMPNKPARPCRYPGCPHLTRHKTGYCDEHLRQTSQLYEKDRGSASARGYDRRWQKYTRSFLAEHPLCTECQRQGRVTAAQVVDHIIPHRGDPELFWDTKNHQALCKPCHDRKTAREDGGFGNRGRGD